MKYERGLGVIGSIVFLVCNWNEFTARTRGRDMSVFMFRCVDSTRRAFGMIHCESGVILCELRYPRSLLFGGFRIDR